jgi:GT2 family glycosyltransferase
MMDEITKQKNEIHETVCAVVVTYNRKNLLIECLDALLKQTRPVDAIYIIDNFSNDGTPDLLKENNYIHELPPVNLKEPWEKDFEIMNLTEGKVLKIYYVRMHENTGGAGGFYEGIKRGYDEGYDWLWLMDDDAISQQNALNSLINVLSIKFAEKIGFICSKVLWIDYTPHIMNLPQINSMINKKPFNYYSDEGILLVNGCSFVSVMINKDVIKEIGLPIKEFFIWADDIEFTNRIISSGYLGIYCNKSKIIHKTKYNQPSRISENNKTKYYYGMRNNLYLVRKKNILKYLFVVIYKLIMIFKINSSLIFPYLKAIGSSLFFNPKIHKVE